ncbi:MAG: hypothetical protein KTV16_15100, partial [Acidimicrobiia bacterium]|nr:hypothetical protein [Acidimicrobiia bacterium]
PALDAGGLVEIDPEDDVVWEEQPRIEVVGVQRASQRPGRAGARRSGLLLGLAPRRGTRWFVLSVNRQAQFSSHLIRNRLAMRPP